MVEGAVVVRQLSKDGVRMVRIDRGRDGSRWSGERDPCAESAETPQSAPCHLQVVTHCSACVATYRGRGCG